MLHQATTPAGRSSVGRRHDLTFHAAADVPAVERYVFDQKRHHAFSAFEALLESD
jgi:hypothetical protein